MQTTSPASRSSLSARSGLISEVSALIAQWFPTHDMEAVATAAADESPDGWLHFDLFITLRTVTYRKKQRYSSFCEGEIGRDLGQIETAHEAREKLAALVASGLINPDSSEEVLAAVPMFGWEVFSTTAISRRTFREMFNLGLCQDKWAIVSMTVDGRVNDVQQAAEKIGKLHIRRPGEVVSRIL